MGLGLSGDQKTLLKFLDENKGKSFTRRELADALSLDPEKIIASLRGLENRGHILSRKSKGGGPKSPLLYRAAEKKDIG